MAYRSDCPVCFSVRALLSVFLVAAAMLGANVYAAEASLTLADAQRRALERSRQLNANDFAAAAARDLAVVAGRLPDPMLKIGIDNVPVDGADRFNLTNDFMTMQRIGLAQELTRADKRRLRAERSGAEAEKALAEKGVTVAAIERDSARAWFERYYAEAMAAVVAEQGAQAKSEIQSAEAAYRGGRGNLADVLAARSALAAIDDRASEVQLRVRNAKTALARWIGADAERPLAGMPDTDRIRLDPAALATELAHHPEIAVLAKQEDIAATAARLAQANKKSDWSVELAYQQRGPDYSNMISFGVSLPLQWNQKRRQDRELSSQLALVEQAKAERDEALRDHIATTRVLIDEWQNKRAREARFEHELIPLARARTHAVAAAYQGGKAGLNDLLAARGNEIDVRIQALQFATDAANLWAQINFLFPSEAGAAHAATVSVGDNR